MGTSYDVHNDEIRWKWVTKFLFLWAALDIGALGGIGLALSKPKILTSDRNGAIYSVGIFEQCNKSIGESSEDCYKARGISEIEEWRWAGALFIIASILSVFSVGCVAMTFRYGGRWLKFVRISHATRNLLLFGKHFQICSLYLSEQTF
eukprot:m.296828 g.296828  ORF g.296828 m.296828 type:complete len:149 (+) comp16393_c9_seq2:281-727(+)